MTRTKLWTTLFALLFVATTALWAAPSGAGAETLGAQLRSSRCELRRAEVRLCDAEAALAAARLAHQRGVGLYAHQVEVARREVRSWRAVISDLRTERGRETLAMFEKSGTWRPLIERAAKKYGISADGLYRLMMMESAGKARAVGAGRFYGLFQYSLVTWRDDWNPWRSESVFDGSAQIEASAYAVKKGFGRSLWGNTFPVAF